MNQPFAVAGHYTGGWDEVRLGRWAAQLRARLDAPTVSLGVVFLTPQFFDVAAEVLEVVRLNARVPLLIGCSSQSLIAGGNEIQDAPGLALQLLHLPGADLKALHFADEDVAGAATPSDWHSLTGVAPGKCNGWLVQ